MYVPLFPANENSPAMHDSVQRTRMLADVTSACRGLLNALRIDDDDPNVRDTASRMARMYVNELCKGRYESMPDCTDFPNSRGLDQLYTIGPIRITSLCSHHFLPFVGHLHIGILPQINEPVLGVSKFARLADWIFSRPQIQEEATIQLADLLEEKCKPRALGVVVRAKHMCMTVRGVEQQETAMTTSVMRGLLLENSTLRAEFLDFVHHGERHVANY